MQALDVLSDPRRRKILEMLSRGPMSSGEIARAFEVTPPAVSQHLGVLREAALVRVQVAAQKRIYELDLRGIDEVSEWIAKLRHFWSHKLDALESQIRKETGR